MMSFKSDKNDLEKLITSQEQQADVKFLMMQFSDIASRMEQVESGFISENQPAGVIQIENLQLHGK